MVETGTTRTSLRAAAGRSLPRRPHRRVGRPPLTMHTARSTPHDLHRTIYTARFTISLGSTHEDASPRRARSRPDRPRRDGHVARLHRRPGATTRSRSATIHRALDLGVTLIDTAEIYGPVRQRGAGRARHQGPARRGRAGHEVRAGLARRRRSRATWTAARPTSAPRSRARCSGSAPTTSTCSTSTGSTRRRRSRTPSAPRPSWSRAGKVRYLGLSEAWLTRSAAPTPSHPITALQSEYSLWTRDQERGAAAAARAGHRPGGLLAARPRLPDRHHPVAGRLRRPTTSATHQPALHRRELPAQPRSRRRGRRARRRGRGDVGPGRLAWLLAQGEDIVPIPGTKRVSRIGGERRRRRGRTHAPSNCSG